jgi:hypothetical protein
VGEANGSRECAPDDRLRVPTIQKTAISAKRWAWRECAFAHSTRYQLQFAKLMAFENCQPISDNMTLPDGQITGRSEFSVQPFREK